MIVIVPPEEEAEALSVLKATGERCFLIGEIIAREPQEPPILWI